MVDGKLSRPCVTPDVWLCDCDPEHKGVPASAGSEQFTPEFWDEGL